MAELAALLFDVDGTLAETERDGHRVAFNRAFAEHGLPWQWDEALYRELLTVAGGGERLAHYAGRFQPDWLRTPGNAERLDAIHQSKNHHFAQLLAAGEIRLRPGLTTLLDAARDAKLALGIVTTTSRANLDALLDLLPPRHAGIFSPKVCGEDVARKKPDPECYLLALRRLRMAPERVLAVEDSRNGLRAAGDAGLRTVIVRSRYFRHEDFSEAAAVVDAFSQLPLPTLRRAAAAPLPGRDGSVHEAV
ncbi:MAG: HAD-IA family hydrolase [Gammaproteobacteria bacterium]|nr:HAD-IA family hydrolase [Gammaproteobacteria bacterium]